ncbi:lytic transglycosylase domain-containing protein [Pseudomonas caricapapayae]|uniref:Hrp-associated lytic transglycosylase n=1 Tax=Pseudomonas caricapapayae TaxID=46678 RepID=A0A3M6GP73_9PSED|nr:transglycosylase SLT domain-containing protein [Pseudomonas caricapapayae]RMV70528.1 Hrp-associated lytic transglycosylase [Pseudomonas caricapapayae]RMV94522.1 Hrp-associated lytic transglycosylase [Pseudomonas caricapapayae]
MPAVALPDSRPRSLARSVQIAVLALGSLCVGCQSVDYAQPRMDRMPRLVAGLTSWVDDEQPGSRASQKISDLPVYNGEDVWQRVAQRCRLADSQGMNERIARQRDWLLSNRGFITGASGRASPYLHFIVERLDERNMPLELALLPMIESSYNPMANSPSAAAGLWQFIPSTGRSFNLNQSATYDARRDVVASSKAAMDYLTRLHDQFDNDWLLALAAYNAGEGTVGRAIEANRRRGLPVDYWHLTLPRETQDYVPRLLALSILVRNPEAYGVKLTPVANTPYFDMVELNHAVDLTQLAATAGVDEGQLVRLNSAFLRKKTPDGPGRLLLPKTQKQVLTAGIARITGESPVTTGPQRVEKPVIERLPTSPPARPVQVVERTPVPKPVQAVQTAEQVPAPRPVESAPVAEQASVAQIQPSGQAVKPEESPTITAPVPAGNPSLVSNGVQARHYIDDRSSPRKRDDIEDRNGPRELPSGPRVVVYASESR